MNDRWLYAGSSSEGNRIRMIPLEEIGSSTPQWIGFDEEPFLLPEQQEDTSAPGYRVFDLVQFRYRDDGNVAAGLALTGVDIGTGRVEVRHAGTDSWIAVPDLDYDEYYLAGPLDEIRYSPGLHVSGDELWAFTAALWGPWTDEPGLYADGDSPWGPISFDERDFYVTVLPTNDPPSVFPFLGGTIRDGRDLETGAYFVDIPVNTITGSNVTEVDGDPKGIAVTDLIDGLGTWVYRAGSEDAADWAPVGGVSEESALLLPEAGGLRLLLDADGWTSAEEAIRFRAWDENSGQPGDRFYVRSVEWDTADSLSRTIARYDVQYLPPSILRVTSNPGSDLIGLTGTGIYDPSTTVPVSVDVPRFFEFQGWTGNVADPAATSTIFQIGSDATTNVDATIIAELSLKPFYAWWTDRLKQLQNANGAADRDNDGVIDLVEYLIDGDPDRFDILDLRSRLMPDRRFCLDLTIPRADLPEGVTVVLLGSDDLVTWDPVAFTREVTDLGNGRYQHAFIQTQNLDEGGKPFLKLRVREE